MKQLYPYESHHDSKKSKQNYKICAALNFKNQKLSKEKEKENYISYQRMNG